MNKLQALIRDFRDAFNRPDLPFVVGEIHAKGDREVVAFNKRLAGIKQKVEEVEVVSASGEEL